MWYYLCYSIDNAYLYCGLHIWQYQRDGFADVWWNTQLLSLSSKHHKSTNLHLLKNLWIRPPTHAAQPDPDADAWFSSLEFWKPIANKSARRACSWRFSLRNSCGTGCNQRKPVDGSEMVRKGQISFVTASTEHCCFCMRLRYRKMVQVHGPHGRHIGFSPREHLTCPTLPWLLVP